MGVTCISPSFVNSMAHSTSTADPAKESVPLHEGQNARGAIATEEAGIGFTLS